MIGSYLKNIFKKEKIHEIEIEEEIINDNLIIELSNRYIAYRLNDNKIEFIEIMVQNCSNFEMLLQHYLEIVDTIVETIGIKINLIILLKSDRFLVKNSNKSLKNEEKLRYFASSLVMNEDSFNAMQLKENSYTIIDHQFIKQILDTFKKYNILDIYEISILNSLQLDSPHIYIDISFGNSEIILNKTRIQKRTLTHNLTSFIDSCAKKLYIDFETSFEDIKINFKDIKTYEQLIQSSNAVKDELINFIDTIYEDIQSSLSYFSVYDNVDTVYNIYINGDILEYDFLLNILKDKLNIELIPLNIYLKINSQEKINLSMLELIYKDKRSILDNLNLDFKGLKHSDNKDEYIFTESRLDESSISNQDTKTKSTNKINLSTGKSLLYDENNKAVWKMDISELGTFIKSRFNEYKNSDKNDISLKDNKVILYTIISIPLIVILVFILNMVLNLNSNFDKNMYYLEQKMIKSDILKRKLASKNLSTNIAKKSDKIFWTQKLITLSSLMPNEIWLSSLTLENKETTIENKKVTNQLIVLESRALPSEVGHISTIASYMDNLLKADDDFKKDFASINFGGATIKNEYGYDVINFKLLCKFDKNINIKAIEEKTRKDKSIGENLKDIKKNTKQKDKILKNL